MRQMSVLKAVLILIVAVGIASATVVLPVQAQETPERELTGITISPGTLSPVFDSDTKTYTVSGITADTDTLSVTATAPDGISFSYWSAKKTSFGTVKVKNVDDPETTAYEAYLADGENVVWMQVWVTSGSGSPSTIYKLNVTRPAAPLVVSGDTEVSHSRPTTLEIDTYSVDNPDEAGTDWSLSGDDSDDFTISSGGVLSFKNPTYHPNPTDANTDNIYEVTVNAADRGHGESEGSLDVTVTVNVTRAATDLNLSGDTEISITQSTPTKVDTYSVDNADEFGTAWSLSGDDSDDFTIGSDGALSFSNTPDYGNPADADTDNVYKVTVNAADRGNAQSQGSLDVTVTVAATVPSAPQNVSATGLVNDGFVASLVVKWLPPSKTGTSPITSYKVIYTRLLDDGQAGHESTSYTYYADWKTDAQWAGQQTDTIAHSGIWGGTTYSVKVVAVNAAGDGAASGLELATIPNAPAAGAPTITGTAQVSKTLTADTTGITDNDGLYDPSYSYQWLADDTDIDGATSSTYTVQSSDNGKVIKVRVTFEDDAGNDESLTSIGTEAVVLGGL